MEISAKEIQVGEECLVRFRAAAPQDELFLIGVYGSTRAEELALTGWDDTQRAAFLKMQFDAQQTHYQKYYPSGEHLIIEVNHHPCGRLYVANIETEIRILDITILPESRNRGIGTTIVKELIAEAAANSKPLTIFVESFNPSRRLFERLGFEPSGEHGASILFRWSGEGPTESRSAV
ncbi:MAG TPA: GNAT family N-acetyltransferase [Blastocatellia bacterium]|nr:GNAT family N-acetyltransferase [Blastocatellia bacterium]